MKTLARFILTIPVFLILVAGVAPRLHAQTDQKHKSKQSGQDRQKYENEKSLEESEPLDNLQKEGEEPAKTDQQSPQRDLIPLPEKTDYQPGKIRVRIHANYRGQCTPQDIAIRSVKDKLFPLGVTQIRQSFPQADIPSETRDKYGREYVDLTLIYEIDFNPNFPVEEAVKLLENDPAVLYVEPAWIMEGFYSPNDPKLGNQYYLGLIHAEDAWDISHGDSSIVIGIIDTGISLIHPDLQDKIAYNYDDPIDGVDNDGDGYVDNFHGWDFGGDHVGSPDNDPTYVGPDHGVLVAGAAAADTDNNWGIASAGFNCRILPVKVTRDNSSGVLYGYAGVQYAADHGAQIINCSWGSGAASEYGEDIINYAVINKGCLVVCAAGNTPQFREIFPAAYPNSLSVGGTRSSDIVWYDNASFGTSWNYEVDISAPAKNIRTTAKHNQLWGAATGTSLASPLVAGAAGVVKAHFPNLSMYQVGQKLRVTADDFYAQNPGHQDLLGKGRLNMYAALTKTVPSIRIDSLIFVDENNHIPEGFDTLSLTGRFFNWLDPTHNLEVEAVSMEPALLEVINSTAGVGVVPTLGHRTNAQPLTVYIKQPVESATTVWLKLIYTDPAHQYRDYEYVSLEIQPASYHIHENKLALTIGDDGNFGYSQPFSFDHDLGIRYDQGADLIQAAGGFLVGNAGSSIADCTPGVISIYEKDFVANGPIRANSSGSRADLEVTATYTDARNQSTPLELSITQHILADQNPDYDDFLIFEYAIHNQSANNYRDLRSGVYAHWDLTSTHWDDELQMIYAWNPDSTQLPYIGWVSLNTGNVNFAAFDRDNFGFTHQDKWNALDNPQSPRTLNQADVITFASSPSLTIAAGDTAIVAFALVAGNNLSELQKNAENAWQKYHCDLYTRMPAPPYLGPDFGLCPGETKQLVADTGYVSYQWSTGQTGNQIQVEQGGTYVLEVTNEYRCMTSNQVSVQDYPAAAPNLGQDFNICTDSSARLDAGQYVHYQWSTGDTTAFLTLTEPGSYAVFVENAQGCTGSDSISVGLYPYLTPNLVQNTQICDGNTTTLMPGFGYVSHTWSNGEHTREIEVSQPGTYSVWLIDDNGCSYEAQTTVSVVSIAVPQLGTDQEICAGDLLSLSPGPQYASYSWNTGATSSSVLVTQTGTYSVTVEDNQGCTAEAQVYVEVLAVPELNLGDQLQICQPSELDCHIPNAAYLWSNGATTRSIWLESSGTYEVQVYLENGCQTSDEVEVTLERLVAGFDIE